MPDLNVSFQVHGGHNVYFTVHIIQNNTIVITINQKDDYEIVWSIDKNQKIISLGSCESIRQPVPVPAFT